MSNPATSRLPNGRFVSIVPAIDRFLAKCRFDPKTGCVLWTGGTTAGRGHTARYGAFKYQGRRWFAHRWAAKFIHGLDIDGGGQVDHCCPYGNAPNPLCVEHLQVTTPSVNRELQWLRVWVGIDEPHSVDRGDTRDPFPLPPEWFDPAAFQSKLAEVPF